MKKKIIITGATGLIGKKITEILLLRGYAVTVITRNVSKAGNVFSGSVEILECDLNKPVEKLTAILEGAFAVIHLAGENVLSKKWTEEHKQNIYNSRVQSTRTIAGAILKTSVKPKVFIGASAVGYYGLTTTKPADEYSKSGTDFLAELTNDWESASSVVENNGVRRVVIRTGVVLDRNEGALSKMITPYKFFLGGPLGSGKQFFPWIHIKDAAGIYLHALENSTMSGAFNAAAPETVTMKEFCNSLGKELNRPSVFYVPEFVLKLLYGEGAGILLNGVNVLPKRTEESGYIFQFSRTKDALKNLL